MPKFVLRMLLVWLLCAASISSARSQTADSAHSAHSTHVESADDQAYRSQQRHRLAIIMSCLLVIAAVYVMRRQKNSPPGARI